MEIERGPESLEECQNPVFLFSGPFHPTYRHEPEL